MIFVYVEYSIGVYGLMYNSVFISVCCYRILIG